ncbi:MAG: hypothetical protein KC800_30525, partial [Candidatus Eremiobacteraeota bacterium]|nr:hypothetical protein [Candidatus Eremiobacteraeota bacterium]
MNAAGLNLNRNWTVESGTSGSRVQTQKVIFADESTKGAESQATGETFSFSTPQAEVAYAPQGGQVNAGGFRGLDADDKGEARRIMKDLNKKARLFARN